MGDDFADNDLQVDPKYDANYNPRNSLILQGGKPNFNGDTTPMGATPLIIRGKKSILGPTKLILGGN